MAKPKTATASHHKKRYGQHKKHSHSYRKVYWPYIPMLLMLLVVLVIGSVQPRQLGRVLGASSAIENTDLLTKTNEARQNQGVEPLSLNRQLNTAAQAKATDMKERNYWSHETPEGEQPWIFINQADYDYQKAGENLAYGFSSSDSTIAGWMRSQSHRENMLDAAYSEVGFGVVEADNYLGDGKATIVVAFYGIPRAADSATVQATAAENNIINTQTPIAFMSTLSAGRATWASLIVGIVTGAAAAFLIARHSVRLRRLLTSGEHFVMHHPVLDLGVTAIILIGVVLLQTVGFVG